MCAALLHDTVEDTGYTLAQLTADFGSVADAHITDDDTPTALDTLDPWPARSMAFDARFDGWRTTP